MKHFLLGLMLLIMAINIADAKSTECLVSPRYDIVITYSDINITSKDTHLNIDKNGNIKLDALSIKASTKSKNEAKSFQSYLRKQLPEFEKQAHKELDSIRDVFEVAIQDKLGNKNNLIKHLNRLYQQLNELLAKSIITKDGTTYFYYTHFNSIKTDGEKIGKKVFYSIVGDSIFKFSVFKNYSAIKKIAKQEWKEQKPQLKKFDDQVCKLVTDIDDKYNHLMIGLPIIK